MARVIDDTPSDEDLEELEMSREELVARFDGGEDAVVRPSTVTVRKGRIVEEGPSGVLVGKVAKVKVVGSSQARHGVTLP